MKNRLIISAVFVTNNSNLSTGKMYYLIKDHLGSITQIYNEDGTLAEEMSYDAWGRRRNPVNWSYTGFTYATIIARGYTEHEHLDEVGLVNMNGRLYDPLVARMLSADNYVQAPDNSQSFNRYSYCWNNPLQYTDPSGDFLGTIFTAVWDFGATIFTKGAIDPWNTKANRQQALALQCVPLCYQYRTPCKRVYTLQSNGYNKRNKVQGEKHHCTAGRLKVERGTPCKAKLSVVLIIND